MLYDTSFIRTITFASANQCYPCRFDFGQTAFSPTELDDSFMFHYRPQGGRDTDPKKISTPNLQEKIGASQVSNAKVDLSRHPPPCQKYLQNISGKCRLYWKFPRLGHLGAFFGTYGFFQIVWIVFLMNG